MLGEWQGWHSLSLIKSPARSEQDSRKVCRDLGFLSVPASLASEAAISSIRAKAAHAELYSKPLNQR